MTDDNDDIRVCSRERCSGGFPIPLCAHYEECGNKQPDQAPEDCGSDEENS